jgi:hypothetical protein
LKVLSKSYEQYCCVLERNVVMEEATYHNGGIKLFCTNYPQCFTCGGCKNIILNDKIEKAAMVNTMI